MPRSSAVIPTTPNGRLLVALALLAALLFGARDITNEGAVAMHDMPRHLMNGVFLYDFLESGTPWTPRAALQYAEHYFARYPALSLGHHPPLLAVSLVPFYAIFGVSVWAGRLLSLSCFLLSVWLVYRIGSRLYDKEAGGWAALLFATNPFVIRYGQIVMSEMTFLAPSLLAVLFLFRFCDTGRASYYAAFVATVVVSLIAKQSAVLLFPVYLVIVVTSDRWRQLGRREVVMMTGIGALLVVPIAVATLLLSPFNVSLFGNQLIQWAGFNILGAALREIIAAHLNPALALAMATACLASWRRRDRTVVFSLFWIVTVLIAVVLLVRSLEPARYAILATPGYALCAAALAFRTRPGAWRLTAIALLTVATLWNANAARRVRPVGGEGYEDAAKYVLTLGPSPTILLSDQIDSGYFVFFVRKHDPEQAAVILRSDKLLTTTVMTTTLEDRIKDRQEIYTLLRKFGTRFLVVSDRPTGAPVLEWLREEVRGDRFVERRRIPIVSRDARLRDEVLVVYEYKDAGPYETSAAINIRIPLIGREINVPLSDLIKE